MPMPVNWIEHNEKRIIFINASNLMEDHVSLAEILQTLNLMLQHEPKKSVLALADLRNTYLTNIALIGLMRNAIRAAPYFLKSALILEANPSQRILLDSFRYIIQQPPKRFSNLDDAKEWLTSE